MPDIYIPGVRNLDRTETAERRRGGWIGLALTVGGIAAALYYHIAAPWRLLVFFPAAMAAIGFIQAGANFCVMVALSHRSPASTAGDREKDRRKAIQLIAAALAVAAVLAVGLYIIG